MAFDPLFTPLEALYKGANDQIMLALNMIRRDFPSHSVPAIEAFVKHIWDYVNSPRCPPSEFFNADAVVQAYRRAHPNETPAASPATPSVSPAVSRDNDLGLDYTDLE